MVFHLQLVYKCTALGAVIVGSSPPCYFVAMLYTYSYCIHAVGFGRFEQVTLPTRYHKSNIEHSE